MRTTWIFVLVGALGCSTASFAPPQVDLVFVDPSGHEWVHEGAQIGNRHLTGEGCEPTDWFMVEGGIDVLAWFPVDRGGPIALTSEAISVRWEDAPNLYLMGGTGHVLTDEPDTFEYALDGAQCVWENDSDTWVCEEEPATATIRLTGDDLSELEPPGYGYLGEPGWATDPATGEERCGDHVPGT